MSRKLLGILMVLLLVAALAATTVLAGGGPPDGDEPVIAEPTEGQSVNVNGEDMKLWIFVDPERDGK